MQISPGLCLVAVYSPASRILFAVIIIIARSRSGMLQCLYYSHSIY